MQHRKYVMFGWVIWFIGLYYKLCFKPHTLIRRIVQLGEGWDDDFGYSYFSVLLNEFQY